MVSGARRRGREWRVGHVTSDARSPHEDGSVDDSHRRQDFWLIARFYGPDTLLFDKTWVMPDVEKVS